MINAPATLFGPAGYKRFEENWYTDMTPDTVLLEGINDCSHGYRFGEEDKVPSAAELMMEDGLHPDTPGGEKMAELVPLELFLNR